MKCRNPFFIRSSLFRYLIEESLFNRSRNPFFIRSSLFLLPLHKTKKKNASRNPFFIRSSLFPIMSHIFYGHDGSRNPFFIRSSLFLIFKRTTSKSHPSQSLFYQVFFVSMISCVKHRPMNCRNPFFIRSSLFQRKRYWKG